MPQETVDNNVMRKLAKIKALADNAGTEGEAFTAAQMLSQLLLKHNMEMTDIEWDLEVKDEPIEKHFKSAKWDSKTGKRYYADYPDVEIKSKRCGWSEDLARMISRTYGCDYLLHPGSSRITFVGRKSNVTIVEYMYITMFRTVESLSWKEYKTARNKTKWEQIRDFPKEMQSSVTVDYSELEGYRNSWINGFVGRVREMLHDEVRRQEQEPSGSTALIRLDKDKVAISKFLENVKASKSIGGGYGWNDAGHAAGRSKADEVGLTASGMNKATDKRQLA